MAALIKPFVALCAFALLAATQPEFVWRHHWRAGDLVLWDNRCTMHRRDPFDPATRRIMHRTQIKGETPPAA